MAIPNLTPLLTALFGPHIPRCPGTGSKLIAARRAATDEKYTARPLDFFPNPLVSREQLEKARAEAGVLDEWFGRYKREARCEGEAKGPGRRLRECGSCREWCCDACRFHTSYRIVSSSPLLFSDEVPLPPGCSDHTLIAPNKRWQTLHIRLRDHEHPYLPALTQQFAQRWHGYCYNCLPRVSASLIRQLDGRFEACRCEREDAVRKYRGRWICAGCFEEECREFGGEFEDRVCRGRGCRRGIKHIGWEGFQPVCGWCLKIVDEKGIEVAKEAFRESADFKVLRKDSRND